VWFTADQGDLWARLPVALPAVERAMVAIW
jgi:hypothetical protein